MSRRFLLPGLLISAATSALILVSGPAAAVPIQIGDAGVRDGVCDVDLLREGRLNCQTCEEREGAPAQCPALVGKLWFTKACSDGKSPVSTEVWCREDHSDSPPIPPKVQAKLRVSGRSGGCSCRAAGFPGGDEEGSTGGSLAALGGAALLAGGLRRRLNSRVKRAPGGPPVQET